MKLLSGILSVAVVCALSTTASRAIGETIAYDASSTFINCSNCLAGPQGGGSVGGTDIRLSWTDNVFNPPTGYQGAFSSIDFTIPGGAPGDTQVSNGEPLVKITAKTLPLNGSDFTTDNDPGSIGTPPIVSPFIIEQNPGNFVDGNGNPDPLGNWVILREIYLYDFDTAGFNDSSLTSLTTPVSNWRSVVQFVDVFENDQVTPIILNAFAGFFPNDGNFTNQPDFDTNGFIQAGFQTPTSDGQDDGANTGLVDLEIRSLSLIPEPSSLTIVLLATAGLCLPRRRI